MGVDVHEPGLDFRDPVGIMGDIGFPQQGIALKVRLENDFNQAFRPVRGFLRKTADAPARRDCDGAGLRRQLAANGVKQG